MKKIIVVIAIVFGIQQTALPQQGDRRSEDEAAVRRVITALADAWTKGDAKLWGEQFTDDADFTAWMGMTVKGRDAITRSHEGIFQGPYKGTKQRATVQSVRFLSPDIAVAHAESTVVKQEAEFPPDPQVVYVCVLVKQDKGWRIAVFHNTRIHSREEVAAFRAKQ